MVTEKKLQKELDALRQEFVKREEFYKKLLVALNKKLSNHIKEESTSEEQSFDDWLKHEGVDAVQDFLHKGVK